MGQLNGDLANRVFAKKCYFHPFKAQYRRLTRSIKLFEKYGLAVPGGKGQFSFTHTSRKPENQGQGFWVPFHWHFPSFFNYKTHTAGVIHSTQAKTIVSALVSFKHRPGLTPPPTLGGISALARSWIKNSSCISYTSRCCFSCSGPSMLQRPFGRSQDQRRMWFQCQCSIRPTPMSPGASPSHVSCHTSWFSLFPTVLSLGPSASLEKAATKDRWEAPAESGTKTKREGRWTCNGWREASSPYGNKAAVPHHA